MFLCDEEDDLPEEKILGRRLQRVRAQFDISSIAYDIHMGRQIVIVMKTTPATALDGEEEEEEEGEAVAVE